MWIQVPIKINDVTLREGDQAPLTSFNRDEKMIIALMLQELGIDNIEAWFASSRVDFENIRWVFEVIDEDWPIIATLGRATEIDTKASIEVIKGYKNARIHIFLATSDEHIMAKFWSKAPTLEDQRNWLLEQVQNEVGRGKKYKDTHNEKLEIEFSPEDATGNALSKREDGKRYLDFESDQFAFLVQVCETAIRAGATIINTPDTLGNFLPHETEAFFRELNKRLSHLREEGYEFEISAHIHNDLWMASANAISAIRGGATQIEVTLNGIGERTGNTPLHEIIGLVGERGHAIIDEGTQVTLSPKIRTELVWATSEFVRRILNLNKSLQTPFIGALSDVDGSGVHNAAQSVYGGTKNKAKYGGASMEEFFSPRGGANQIVSLLSRFWIQEDKSSQLIGTVTHRACEKSEQVKALYGSNVFALYMKETEKFEIQSIDIDGNKIQVIFVVNGRQVTIEWEWQWENGFIDGLVSAINNYIWEDIIDIESIRIVNKPSLREAYQRYLTDVWNTTQEVSDKCKARIERIISRHEQDSQKSKQIWVAHVKLKVGDREVSSVSSAHDINYAMAKAIIEWVLPEIVSHS